MLYCPLISFPHALILWPMSYWIKASSVYSLLFTLVHSFIHSFILFFLSCVFLYLCSHVSYGVVFKIEGQHLEALLLPYGFQGLNSVVT